MKTVAVIGGGVIGAACAYSLVNAGYQVTIIEQKQFGHGSSLGNCGLILPSHVLPLNMPGTLLKSIKWMMDKDAPLYLKPRIDLELWQWFFKFIRHCNHTDMMRAAVGNFELLKDSAQLFDELIHDEQMNCDWHKNGVVYAFNNPHELAAYQSIHALVRLFLDDGVRIDHQQMREKVPFIKTNLAGAYFYRSGAHLRPDRLMREYQRILTKRGVRIIENQPIKIIDIRENQLISVGNEHLTVKADQFVFATGAWTALLRKKINLPVCIQPGKGYSLTTDTHISASITPCLFEDARVVATPWSSGFRLGGTMEFSGFDETIDEKRMVSLVKGAQNFMNQTINLRSFDGWIGLRPMTFSGLPIIDFLPGLNNAVIAAGHNMLGLTMAIRTGKLITELLTDQTPTVDMKPYKIA
ncbi:MAG: FAD-dependent oxidoreductase [Pseudomonadota bacterium]